VGERPNDPGETLSVRLFAPFEVRLGERVLIDSTWPRAKAKALIKLLALQPGLSLHREQVFELLWPELTAEGAAAQLRQNLYFLRATLREAGAPESLVASDGQLVALSANASVDIEAFRQAAAAARAGGDSAAYERALGFCAGDLLPEDLYEEWTQRPRAELTRLRDDLLLELGRRLLSEGQPADAVPWLSRLVKAEPAREDAQRELIRAFALAGSRDNALRQYQECRETLERELGVAPSPETEALYREIAAGRVGTNGDVVAASVASAAVAGQSGRMSRWGRSRLLRAGALVAALCAAGGAAFGGLAVAGVWESGGEAAAEYKRGNMHVTLDGEARPVSGDCSSSDVVYALGQGGSTTGILPGRLDADYTTTFLLETGCQSGTAEGEFVITDRDGNSVKGTNVSFISLVAPADASSSGSVALPKQPIVLFPGSGLYEHIAGRGLCELATQSEAVSADLIHVVGEGDCSVEFTLEASPAFPVTAEGGSSATRVSVKGRGSDVPDVVSVVVQYLNAGDTVLRGLEVRVPDPYGGAINVSAAGEPFAAASTKTWTLPELAPGEVQQFYFDVQLLSANGDTIFLQPEIRGGGLENPARTTPIRIEVAQ
jgi:DNA-binding SARP family transcriptional activator